MSQQSEPNTSSEHYCMPAEWSPHAATWIAWPHNAEDWPGKFQPIPWVYAEIVRHLSRVEDVHILVNNPDAENRATGHLKRGGANLARLHFHHWPTDRVWLRDSGPIFVKNPQGDLAATNWKFNAWAKYDNWRPRRPNPPPRRSPLRHPPDQAAGRASRRHHPPPRPRRRLHRHQRRRHPHDHRGVPPLKGPGAQPRLGDCEQTRRHLEQAFRQYLGIHQTIWLTAVAPATTPTATSTTSPAL